jgi:RND family efflux transporter MFP subunit
LLLLAGLVVVVAGGIFLLGRGPGAKASHPEVASAAAPEGSAENEQGMRVQVARPEKGGLTRTSTQIGSVHPFQQAQLYAKVSGYLKLQEVDIGSRVHKGDLLAEIDDPEVVKEAARADAALKQANAMVAQAEAHVKTAKADVKSYEAAVAKAKALVASTVARRNYRQKQLRRNQDLFKRQAIPEQLVDEYEDHYETTVAEVQSAEAEQLSAHAQLEAAKAKVVQAEADLAEARSNVEVCREVKAKADVLVDYTRIKSPYDGVITLRNFFVGDFIRSASDGNEHPMLTVARTDKMRVVTYIPDRDVPFTDVGDKAVITLDALPGKKFEGTVSRYSYSEEAESRTMRTEVDLMNPDGLLREGMFGIASIVLEKDTTSWTIPSACLAEKVKDHQSSVFVVRNGRAHKVPVTVGINDGVRVEIVKGVGPDDQVITNKGVEEDLPVVVETARPAA